MDDARYSVFDVKSLQDMYQEIRELYRKDNRPWVIGFSGGKDSTATLQLVWNAIATLPRSDRTKVIYIISTDTMVETPVMGGLIDSSLQKMNEKAAESGLPIKAIKLTPQTTDTFWVNLIGRGYPAPSKTFRWCTDRLKIRPADKFIIESVAKFGEVVIILGVRKRESATRAQVMSMHKIKDSLLSRHIRFPQAFVYTPLEDFTVDDVWTYLLQTQSPWGGNNRNLLAIYKNAQAGECPLVIDNTTPSCGNSRFGCWVCTVVSKDKSMEALVEGGEEWMEPLLDYRNLLAETQIPENKRLYRDFKRMNGKATPNREKTGLVPGPYKFEFCVDLLSRLLEIQKKIQSGGHMENYNLITDAELLEIRRIWVTERSDWKDTLPKIYAETMGKVLDWPKDDLGTYNEDEELLLSEVAKKHGVPMQLVTKLIDLEHELQGLSRRSNILNQIEEILGQEWRPEELVLAEIEKRRKEAVE